MESRNIGRLACVGVPWRKHSHGSPMKTLAPLLSFVWLLAFLSPLLAVVGATVFYGRYCRERPEADRRLTGLAYALMLLACAVVAYPVGVQLGINWACPSKGNLCGLAGFFVVGPLASAVAILVVGSLLTGALLKTRP
jgi:hypothetical protein